MQEVFLIGLVVVLGGLLCGWALRRRAPRPAEILHHGAAALARVLAAVALIWTALGALHRGGMGYLLLAAVLVLIALGALLLAVPHLIVAAKGRQAPT